MRGIVETVPVGEDRIEGVSVGPNKCHWADPTKSFTRCGVPLCELGFRVGGGIIINSSQEASKHLSDGVQCPTCEAHEKRKWGL